MCHGFGEGYFDFERKKYGLREVVAIDFETPYVILIRDVGKIIYGYG